MKRDLVVDRVYKHPPELVWHALTDSAALGEWLMANDFEPRVGHRFQFHTDPAPGFDGVVHCEVLEVKERERLSYTWRGGAIDTVITFTLEAVAGGTRLMVRQTGFHGLKAVLISYILQRGVPGIYDRNLPALLERLQSGGGSTSGGAVSCKTESWDTIGTRMLVHAANITPGARNADTGSGAAGTDAAAEKNSS